MSNTAIKNILLEYINEDIGNNIDNEIKKAISDNDIEYINNIISDNIADYFSKDLIRLAIYFKRNDILSILFLNNNVNKEEDNLLIEFASRVKNYDFIKFIFDNGIIDPTKDNNKLLRDAVHNNDLLLVDILLSYDNVLKTADLENLLRLSFRNRRMTDKLNNKIKKPL